MTPETFQFRCEACEHLFNEDEAGAAKYACSRCGQEFTRDESADGDSNRCPECNIFAALIADMTCPECGSEEVEEGEFEGPPEPTAEELAERAAKQVEAEAHSAILRAEHDAKRQAQRQKWEALGDWWALVDAPGGKLDHATFNFMEGSSGSDLPLELAERIAATLLGTLVPPPLPSVLADGYDEARAAQRGRWTVDGFARAFAGVDQQGDDLAPFLAHYFGSESGAVGVGLTEAAYYAVAERLVTAAKRQERAA